MAKREFLMQAHSLDKEARLYDKQWYVSEKLDGLRAFWDGGITRDRMPTFTKGEVATGLWSRYGKIIHAPKNWLNKLPPFPLDGELWIGRNRFQEVVSITKQKLHPSETDWEHVQYLCYDSPGLADVFAPGVIEWPNRMMVITAETTKKLRAWAAESSIHWGSSQSIAHFFVLLKQYLEFWHVQKPYTQDYASLFKTCQQITNKGGEGLMLRCASLPWETNRSWGLLKLKLMQDAEATVVGYTFGRKTTKGSKLLGLMGALKVNWHGHYFDLSGFTDIERDFATAEMVIYACDHPGEIAPSWVENKTFPRGSQVTFQYRTVTKDGIPREARYWRKYNVHLT